MKYSPPHMTERMLLALGADTEFRNDVLGDLTEEFELRASYDERAARRWYNREALRVAPYLLRNWWRMLGKRDVGYFAGVLARTALIMVVFQVAIRVVYLVVFLVAAPQLTGGEAFLLPLLLVTRLLWTMIGGALAGYVATRLGRRAPLPSALLIGATWSAVILLRAPTLLIVNVFSVLLLTAGVLTGAMLGVRRQSTEFVELR
jgi:hypothetical protein